MSDAAVVRPKHYNMGKYEVIDVIEDWKLGFSKGNAVKYIARAGRKDPTKEMEDLEKAVYYLLYEIQRLKLVAASATRFTEAVPVGSPTAKEIAEQACMACGHRREQHAASVCSGALCGCSGFLRS